MAYSSVGRFKCRVSVERHDPATELFPRGMVRRERWEDREVEVLVDGALLAKWLGSSAHNAGKKGKVTLDVAGVSGAIVIKAI